MGKHECKECGGSGKVVVKLVPEFNTRLMEVHVKEIIGPCDCFQANEEVETMWRETHS